LQNFSFIWISFTGSEGYIEKTAENVFLQADFPTNKQGSIPGSVADP
jgi:hypothetical protein